MYGFHKVVSVDSGGLKVNKLIIKSKKKYFAAEKHPTFPAKGWGKGIKIILEGEKRKKTENKLLFSLGEKTRTICGGVKKVNKIKNIKTFSYL